MFSTADTCDQLVEVRLDARAPPRVGVDDDRHARDAGRLGVADGQRLMLKARRRNSDATRFRTPGLFST